MRYNLAFMNASTDNLQHQLGAMSIDSPSYSTRMIRGQQSYDRQPRCFHGLCSILRKEKRKVFTGEKTALTIHRIGTVALEPYDFSHNLMYDLGWKKRGYL